MAGFWQQLKALLWRNILLKKRNKGQVFQELLFPVYFVAILAMIRAFTKPDTKPALHFPATDINNSIFGSPFCSTQKIIVVQDTSQIQTWMRDVVAQLPCTPAVSYFASVSQAEDAYKTNKSNVAGIIFNVTGNDYSYSIRMGHNNVPRPTDTFSYNKGSCRDNENGISTASDCKVNLYLKTGFAQLQLAIENVLMTHLGLSSLDPKSRTVQVQMMDKGEFLPDTSYIQSISSIYFVFSFALLANFLAVNIVSEKEKKIKDGMLMMGLRSSVFWLSWTIVYLVMVIIASVLMIAIVIGAEFFRESSVFLLFLCFILYGSSIIALAFMLTPFFNKAKVAGAVVGFCPVIVSCLYLAVSLTRDSNSYDSKVPAGVQYLMCLFAPLSFATFIDQAIFMDVFLGGFGFDDSLTYGKFPLLAPILMLLVDIILYSFLAIYFDKVIPGEYGVRYPPLYFLQSSYWCPGKHSEEDRRLMTSNRSISRTVDVEAVPANMQSKAAMRISGLTKSFKSEGKMVNAVDAFYLDIYEGQITCLLGHNGAGKTTLLNMLTGVVVPTSGYAKVLGLDITRAGDLTEIRKRCGICPQHNILYDVLSCYEHLKMFANIKGVPEWEVEATVKQALKDVDLTSQTDTFAKDLSGGQKRKLSVAMALIGDPKLIFLDEPTAGMDPYSRRHLWSLLKEKKEGRVVLLTTHFMDEADILADRKAFIRKGKLRCCGSSLFLKNKFGIGYHVNMVVTPDCDEEKVTSLLQSVIPSVKHQRSHGKEIGYTVPLQDVSNFSAMFAEVDKNAESLGIRNYGVTMTTLEEVFLNLEADENVGQEDEETGEINESYASHPEDVNVILASIGDGKTMGESVIRDNELAKQRFWALLRIRFLLMIRNSKAVFFQVVVPVVLVIVGLVLLKLDHVSPPSSDSASLLMTPDMYARAAGGLALLPPFLAFDALNSPASEGVISYLNSSLAVDRYPAGTVNTSAVYPHFIGMQLNNVSGQVLRDFVVLYNDSAVHSIPVLINLATNSMLNKSNIAYTINVSSYPWPQDEQSITYSSGAMSSALLVGLAFIMALAGFATEIVQDREWKLRGQLRISGVSFNQYWGTIYLSDFAVYLLPASLIIIITLAMQIEGLSSAGAMGALAVMFILNIPFNITLALVISFLFSKSETCTAYLPMMLQMSSMLPYLAVSLVDMITQGDVGIVLHYVFCIVDPPYIIFGGFYFISRVHLIAVFSGSTPSDGDYFKFDSHIPITFIMPIVHMVWMYWLLRMLDVWKTGGKVAEAFPCLRKSSDSIPAPNPDVTEDEEDDVAAERQRIDRLHTVDEPRFSRIDSSSLLSTEEPVAYMSQLRKTFVKRVKKKHLCDPGKNKVKVAVRNLSIGVDRGEVLGLLGPNGAGKSTALNMMIAEIGPTSGKVVVSGHNIRSNTLSLLESLGYCPQHDALWETITLEEHIRCFAAIKGVDPKQLDEVVDYYIGNLKLEDHRKKNAKKLSGGTKRKLSYIMSILGSPHLVLMDEPSTGMDPQSKRFLWDTISSTFQDADRGAILTTHYMEEADALCNRVGIMVNGQLKCLGSTQHLKNKYGSGYILEVKLGINEENDIESLMDNLEAYLKELFPGLERVERFMERAQYSIPQEDVKSLGETFANLENCKQTYGLEEYGFSQSTLEQVFLHFAKQQLEEEANENMTTSPSRRSVVPLRSDMNGTYMA